MIYLSVHYRNGYVVSFQYPSFQPQFWNTAPRRQERK